MALDEAADIALYKKTHYQIYVTISNDGGATWLLPRNVITETSNNVDSLYFEGAYPSIAKLVDNNMYIEYQRDYVPGIFWGSPAGSVDSVANDPLNNTNHVIVAAMPVIQIFIAINEIAANGKLFFVAQNQPNPAQDFTLINVQLSKAADLKLELKTTDGLTIYSYKQNKISGGKHLININTAAYSKGLYFYTVTVNGERITKKMIID